MYQFPLEEITENEFHSFQNEDKNTQHISSPIKHILSHQHILARFIHKEKFPLSINPSWIKIKLSELQDFPIPRLIDKYLEIK